MTKRRILGIDPGTGILGFGVVDCEIGKPIKMITGGVISTPAHTPIEIRLEEIYNGLKEIIEETKPDEVSIEKLFFSKKCNNGDFSCTSSRCSDFSGSAIENSNLRIHTESN